jgi:hypothetical protein
VILPSGQATGCASSACVATVYPKLAKVLADGHGLSAMSRAHREILHLARLLARIVEDLPVEKIRPLSNEALPQTDETCARAGKMVGCLVGLRQSLVRGILCNRQLYYPEATAVDSVAPIAGS